MNIIADSVDISQIDLDDTTFKITTDESTDDLVDSIKNVGLISPPILMRKSGGRYTIVCGFRRIDACRLLGWKHIEARVIPVCSNDARNLILAIADNTYNRQLNLIEQAVSISKLSKYYEDDTALTREANKAGLPVNPGLVKKLKKINAAHEALKRKMAADVISLTIGLELAELELATALVLIRIIEELKLTLNHQKELIRLVKEISLIKQVPAANIINDVIISKIINHPEIDRNQKIKKMRHTLKQIRYPEIVRFEEKYFDHLQRMDLPESIHLIPPADFEGNNYSMSLNFNNRSQFQRIVETLTQLQNHPDFAKILEKNFEDN